MGKWAACPCPTFWMMSYSLYLDEIKSALRTLRAQTPPVSWRVSWRTPGLANVQIILRILTTLRFGSFLWWPDVRTKVSWTQRQLNMATDGHSENSIVVVFICHYFTVCVFNCHMFVCRCFQMSCSNFTVFISRSLLKWHKRAQAMQAHTIQAQVFRNFQIEVEKRLK